MASKIFCADLYNTSKTAVHFTVNIMMFFSIVLFTSHNMYFVALLPVLHITAVTRTYRVLMQSYFSWLVLSSSLKICLRAFRIIAGTLTELKQTPVNCKSQEVSCRIICTFSLTNHKAHWCRNCTNKLKCLMI